MEETSGDRKLVGAIWLLAATVTIVAAFVIQPIGEWGWFSIILAVLLAILGLNGAWMLATGKGRITNRRTSPKTQRILSIIGLVAATVLVVSYLVADWANWTAFDSLSIGIWIAIGAMFLDGLLIANRSR